MAFPGEENGDRPSLLFILTRSEEKPEGLCICGTYLQIPCNSVDNTATVFLELSMPLEVPTRRIMHKPRIQWQLTFVVLLSWAGAAAAQGVGKDPLVFYAMGDVPYAVPEKALLRKQLTEIPQDARFVIHVGDIKRGAAPCDRSVYQEVSSILATSKHRLFIVPGDNEWNDCAEPAEAWRLWKQHFMRFDARWEKDVNKDVTASLVVARSKERPENFAFVERQTLVVGLNVVGGRVHDAAEWRQRHSQCLGWLTKQAKQNEGKYKAVVVLAHARPAPTQKDFFDGFSQLAGDWKLPTLYLHGDGHVWTKDRPFESKNILRVQVDQGGKAPPVRVAVFPDREQPFELDRRKPK